MSQSPPPRLDSCWSRFQRAAEHMKALEKEIHEWARDPPYAFRRQVSGDGTRFAMHAEERKAPDLQRWSVISCDAFANLRCSLDHLVWALAEARGILPLLTDRDQRALAFPIGETPERFGELAGRNLKAFDAAAVDAIESVQPFKRPHSDVPPLLAQLKDIDDKNKHRLLRPVSWVQGGSQNAIRNVHPPIPRGVAHQVVWNELEVREGTEAIALVFSEPQTADFTYSVVLEFGAAFRIDNAPNPSIRFRNVSVVFNEIADEVRRVINIVSVV